MIENHVVSLPLAKRLRDAGVSQESEFGWWPIKSGADGLPCEYVVCRGNRGHWSIPAHLSSEIGAMLPDTYISGRNDYEGVFFCGPADVEPGKRSIGPTAAEAAGEAVLALALIERGIVEAKQEVKE